MSFSNFDETQNNAFFKPSQLAVGQRLNQMDGDLAPRTLVGHLPTSPRQLNALRHQIQTDLNLLQLEISDLEAEKNPTAESRITILRVREARLTMKLAEIDTELARQNPFQRLGRLSLPGQKGKRGLLAWVLSRGDNQDSDTDPPEPTLDQVCDELESLKHLLEEALHDPTKLDAGRLAMLVSQFDRQSRLADKMAEGLRPKH